MSLNERASIHPNAQIGEGVEIGPFSTIEADVVIGEGTWIGPNVVIMNGARIGKNCKIFPGAVISGDPQDLKYKGEVTTVEIGDNTSIREFATIHKGTDDRMKTVIGKNCLIMAYVHVAHDCILGDNVILANNTTLAGHVVVKNFAVLEAFSGAQQFIEVGEHAFVGAGTFIKKDVPPYVRAARDPIAYIGVNRIGLERRGFSIDSIRGIEDIYRTVYQKRLNNTQALEVIEQEEPESSEKLIITDFIKNSANGIIRGGS